MPLVTTRSVQSPREIGCRQRHFRFLGTALVASMSWLFAGDARAQVQTARELVPHPLVCGIPLGDQPRQDYFAHLCRAFGVAILGDDVVVTLQMGSEEQLVRWVTAGASSSAEGELPLAVGVPLELRSDVDIRFGPPVLIDDGRRWALAYASDAAALGELVSWLFHALVQAEAYGVDSEMLRSGPEEGSPRRLVATGSASRRSSA